MWIPIAERDALFLNGEQVAFDSLVLKVDYFELNVDLLSGPTGNFCDLPNIYKLDRLDLLLLTWFNFNPSMDK